MKPTAESDVKTGIASLTLDPALPTIIVQREARKEVKYQQHEAASYAYKIVSIDLNFEAPLKMYVGTDAPSHFLHEPVKDADNIFKGYIRITPNNMENYMSFSVDRPEIRQDL